MLRVTSEKLAQRPSWLDDINDVEWLDEEPDFFPSGDRPEPPDEGAVDETNYTDFLADDVDEDRPEDQPKQESFLDEIPIGNQELLQEEAQPVEYQDPFDLIHDARARQEVISFQYVNRHGAYAGWRTVEPHYIFPARTTGNIVLVAWDRDVDDIRAFIIGSGASPVVSKQTNPSAGIQSGGIRYENERFEWRPEIVSV